MTAPSLVGFAADVADVLETAGHEPAADGKDDGFRILVPTPPGEPDHVLVKSIRRGPAAALPASVVRRPLAAYEAALAAAEYGVAWWEVGGHTVGLVVTADVEDAERALAAAQEASRAFVRGER